MLPLGVFSDALEADPIRFVMAIWIIGMPAYFVIAVLVVLMAHVRATLRRRRDVDSGVLSYFPPEEDRQVGPFEVAGLPVGTIFGASLYGGRTVWRFQVGRRSRVQRMLPDGRWLPVDPDQINNATVRILSLGSTRRTRPAWAAKTRRGA